MKTVLLFSTIFYLLGLKMGNTVEVIKKFIAPVKSIIHAPAKQSETYEKSYFYLPEETKVTKKATSKKKENDLKDTNPILNEYPDRDQPSKEVLRVH